ncbi:hypothetical protein C4U45_16960, partial [Clostridioides difficile]
FPVVLFTYVSCFYSIHHSKRLYLVCAISLYVSLVCASDRVKARVPPFYEFAGGWAFFGVVQWIVRSDDNRRHRQFGDEGR